MPNALILKDLILKLGISTSEFERRIGVGSSTVHRAITRNSQIKTDVMDKIVKAFPQVNRNWLESGEGEMMLVSTNELTAIQLEEMIHRGFMDAIGDQIATFSDETIETLVKNSFAKVKELMAARQGSIYSGSDIKKLFSEAVGVAVATVPIEKDYPITSIAKMLGKTWREVQKIVEEKGLKATRYLDIYDDETMIPFYWLSDFKDNK